jgi:hypothetical protein
VRALALAGLLASLVPSVASGARPSDLHVDIGGDGSGWGLAGDAVVGPQKGSWTAEPVLDGSRLRIHALNGFGDGLRRTAAAIGDTVAILTVSDCSADPVPRWRAVLDEPWRRPN